MKGTPQAGQITPVESLRIKQFDSRMLDRLETTLSQYRHWHGDVEGLPSEYVMHQRAAYTRMLRDAAQSVAEELSRWL